ncbi:MAG: hypothetical protein M2R45_05046 [Verrucomicrobia subdivision 3 bacterium]|nr:hypothetical protein [Limisphaerales bacterium]MCS1412551.1 hypothetical protein [Limisphaerales bacterium]
MLDLGVVTPATVFFDDLLLKRDFKVEIVGSLAARPTENLDGSLNKEAIKNR